MAQPDAFIDIKGNKYHIHEGVGTSRVVQSAFSHGAYVPLADYRLYRVLSIDETVWHSHPGGKEALGANVYLQPFKQT